MATMTCWSPPSVSRRPGREPRSRWTDLCQLELPVTAATGSQPWASWSIELRSGDGGLVHRQRVDDPAILTGRTRVVDLEPHRFVGADPERLVIHQYPPADGAVRELSLPLPAAFRRRTADLVRWVLSHEIPARTISFCPLGGLANQLYQAGAMLGYARRHEIPWVCEQWKTTSPSMLAPRPTYWDSVFSELVRLSEGRRRDPLKEHAYGDPSFSYTEIPRRHDHQVLWGHFLSYRYFESVRDELLTLLWGGRGIAAAVAAALPRLRASLPRPGAPLVSIHVRRGDQLLNRTLTPIPEAYFRAAMALFPGAVFAVFSDDIPWCRQHLRHEDLVYVEGHPDTVDLFLMASCDHHIICNSTYGWWAAQLDRRPGGRVVYPLPWYAGAKRARCLTDFIPPGWSALHLEAD